MRGRKEVIIPGGGKVPGASGRPCRNAAGGANVETVTSRNYHKTPFLREIKHEHQVTG